MIPLQITLQGFLSYREKTTISFEGASLWMLAGANGAGKSSVFDAMRWTLFGAHRGGKSGHEALIHRDLDRLRVAFDLALGEQRFRLIRTLARAGRSTWQIEEIREGEILKVPETDGREGYEKWVRERIGLSDETFTTAMYLAQNRGDAMLSANPTQRYEMLAEIVDISAYAALHERARVVAAQRENAAKIARQNWELAPDADPQSIEALRGQLRELAIRLAQNGARREAILGLEPLAAQWQKWRDERAAAQKNLDGARLWVADAPQIEREAARQAELETLLPPLSRYALARGRAAQTGRELAALDAESEATRAQLQSSEAHLQAAQRDFDALESARAAAETARLTALSERASLAPRLALSRQIASYRAEIAGLELELGAFAPDLLRQKSELETHIARAREELAAGAILRRFAREKTVYRAANTRETAARARIEALQSEWPAAQGGAETLRLALENARQKATRALETASAAATRHEDALAARARFESVEGEADCFFCGQKLTPQHVESERSRLEIALQNAETEAQNAQNALETANRAAREAQTRFETARVAAQNAETALQDAHRERQTAAEASQTARQSAQSTFAELPATWRAGASPRDTDAQTANAQTANAAPESGATRAAPGSNSRVATGLAGLTPTSNLPALDAGKSSRELQSAVSESEREAAERLKSERLEVSVSRAKSAPIADSNHAAYERDAENTGRENAAFFAALNGDFPDVAALTDAEVLAASIRDWRGKLELIAANLAQQERVELRLGDRRSQLAPLVDAEPLEGLQELEARDAAAQNALETALRALKNGKKSWESARLGVETARGAVEAARESDAVLESQRVGLLAAQIERRRAVSEEERGVHSAILATYIARDESELSAVLSELQGENTALSGGDLDARREQLRLAQGRVAGLEIEAAGLDRSLEGVPLEARRAPDELRAEVAALRSALDGDREAEGAALAEKNRLVGWREAKTRLEREHLEAENRARQARTLADLLGPHQLQRFLLREAENGIVDEANAVLDRISSGSLRLELRADDEEIAGARKGLPKVLDLAVFRADEGGSESANASGEAMAENGGVISENAKSIASNEAANEAEIGAESADENGGKSGAAKAARRDGKGATGVLSGGARAAGMLPAFLSGSQRFRVSVALALGIGRFATRGGGSRLEAVIIDEGFGALDKIGRGEMIDELQMLGQELQRVILVSHQEEFFEAFPNRYLIENDGFSSTARLMAE